MTTLTPETLAELRELERKATGGPAAMEQCRATIGGHEHIIWEITNDTANIGLAIVILPDEDDCPDARQEREATATLITQTLTALPSLLDAAEELARVHQWARQPHVCGGTCTNAMNGGNCGTCTSGGRNAEYKDEPGWTDNFKPEWNRERRDIPPTQAFREMREEFGHHFDGIDVDKFCHDVRYGEDEGEATK